MKPIRAIATVFCMAALGAPAGALVGGAELADSLIARHVVMVLVRKGTSEDICTATAIARDLLLTAAHCLRPGGSATVMTRSDKRETWRSRVSAITRHPDYDDEKAPSRQDAPDLALLKLATPIPAGMVPATLAERSVILVGERFTVAGYGLTNDTNEFGVLRAASLMAIRSPSDRHFLLGDPSTRGKGVGLGVCMGDSGGPVFDYGAGVLRLVAVIRFAQNPTGSGGCGGISGAVPITPYRDWIMETAKKMGSAVVW